MQYILALYLTIVTCLGKNNPCRTLSWLQFFMCISKVLTKILFNLKQEKEFLLCDQCSYSCCMSWLHMYTRYVSAHLLLLFMNNFINSIILNNFINTVILNHFISTIIRSHFISTVILNNFIVTVSLNHFISTVILNFIRTIFLNNFVRTEFISTVIRENFISTVFWTTSLVLLLWTTSLLLLFLIIYLVLWLCTTLVLQFIWKHYSSFISNVLLNKFINVVLMGLEWKTFHVSENKMELVLISWHLSRQIICYFPLSKSHALLLSVHKDCLINDHYFCQLKKIYGDINTSHIVNIFCLIFCSRLFPPYNSSFFFVISTHSIHFPTIHINSSYRIEECI